MPAAAQGLINFSTRVGASVNAPVIYLAENTLADGRFFGQLYAAAPFESLAPVGNPSPFRSDVGKGYITAGGNVSVPGVQPGSLAQVKLVAWASWLGNTYAEAIAQGRGDIGESAVIEINLGGGLMPPATLFGLQAFVISPIIPEPSAVSLIVVGMAMGWRYRKSLS